MGHSPQGVTVVTLLADPDAPTEVAQRVAQVLPARLADESGQGRRFDVEVVSEPFTAETEDLSALTRRIVERRRAENWDIVVALTDLPHRSATTAVGVRELAAATGLLGRPHPVWLWGRVGGDLMDLTMLTRALRNHDGRGLGRTVAATAAVTAITATDVYAAVTRTRRSTPMELTAATTVTRPPDEAYALWRDLERLPDFMGHLDEVHVTGPRTSHWQADAPFGKTVEWDAEITQDVPGQVIAWRSVDGADIDASGEARFVPAPGGQGTEIRVTLRYGLPGGTLGKAAARYFGEEPHQQLDDDLRRFKQIAETGEVVRSEGAPGGKRARGEFPQHPARPLTEDELKEALA